MRYETIIGLEVHVQLRTRTKLFCGCVNRFEPDEPNTQTCPVCLGLPGSLPVMNREAYRLGVRTALALHCEIAAFTKWDRKQYFYPDLPKAYQISQYDLPFSSDGWLEVEVRQEGADVEGGSGGLEIRPTESRRRVGIIRAHLEEDAGKNVHDETGRGRDSRVDLNRTGTPLVEIVTQPDLRSAAEARAFLSELRLMLLYLGVSDCNMQEGSLRCDANVNLKVHTDDGHHVPTPIVEIKNLNSFSNVERAIEHEALRQFTLFQQDGRRLGDVPKQTRGWDANRNVTTPQREKEEAADYRYFPDPDLVPVTITADVVESMRADLPEPPAARRKRFESAWQLSPYDAAVIVDQGRTFADFYETVAAKCEDGKLAANWVTQDVLRELNERALAIESFPIDAATLGTLLSRIAAGGLTTKSGREVFGVLIERESSSPADVDAIVKERGLAVVSDTSALEGIVDAVIARNPGPVEDVRGGKQQAAGPLIGQVMREVKGADAKVVRELLLKRIAET